jgi:hypothetical protein
MKLYIHENWQAGAHKAVIHRGSCGHCKDGAGRAGSHDPRDARWHGPFKTLEEAEDLSAGLSAVAVPSRCRCV